METRAKRLPKVNSRATARQVGEALGLRSALGKQAPAGTGAILDTRYLSTQVKSGLANGLEARHDELVRDQRTGYMPGGYDPRIEKLCSVARQAYALGLLSYLPKWADHDPT